jgi:hypothetical protein
MDFQSSALAPRSPFGRSRVTNRPSKMVLDARSELGRRVRDLAHAYAELLGGWAALSDTMAANVRRAAELVALAENARADALRNGNTDALGLVRLEGAANRAVRALQLDRKKREPGAAPSLSEYLRSSPMTPTGNDGGPST